MRQVFQKSYLSKDLCVEEVPPPKLEGTGVLVQNGASLISPGTERATVAFARKGLIAKIQSQPERIRLLFRKMQQNGILETLQLARRKLENPIPMGYSTAGVVIGASPDMPHIRNGDRVACAGARYANHAEVAYIPKNLCVPLPANLSLEEGAFVAPGAIALHGVRLAELSLGETVLVIGLGLIGQLTAQLVQTQGVQAIGVDLDPARLKMARDLGISSTFHRDDPGLQAAILAATQGRGVDAVLVTAATPSQDPVYLAGELCRERGKVVIVGDVGMQIPRSIYYEKELSVWVSRSYGPGRYDDTYELHGQDYPSAYVRWTERDNMSAFLKLAAEGKIQLKPLIEKRYPVEDALQAYDLLADPTIKPQPLGIILTYPTSSSPLPESRKLALSSNPTPVTGAIGLSVIGAGQFLSGTLLPILRKQAGFSLRGLVSHSGLSAKTTGQQGGFAFCSTDMQDILSDAQSQAILIATRHDSHADLVCQTLRAGKHVFMEKPLATNREELQQCMQTASSHPDLQVMVGFNRRFAPMTVALKAHLDRHASSRPLGIRYRILAGMLPENHWTHEHGGRVVGEVCHFIDWCLFMTGEQPETVTAQSVGSGKNQDILIRIQFSGGSVADIHYLMRMDLATAATLGKERIEVFSAGMLAELEDFRSLNIYQGGKRVLRKHAKPDKGHSAEIQAFMTSLKTGQAAITWEELLLTTETSFAALEALQSCQPARVQLPEIT